MSSILLETNYCFPWKWLRVRFRAVNIHLRLNVTHTSWKNSFRNKYCERATMKKYCCDNKIIYEILNIHCRSLHSFCHEFTRTFLGKFNFV